MRAFFGSGVARTTFDAWTDTEVFARLCATIEREVPGLISVMATRDVQIVGHTPEGADLAHVVVRTTPYTDGSAASRIAVISVRRVGGRWRVVSADDLDSLDTALLRVPAS